MASEIPPFEVFSKAAVNCHLGTIMQDLISLQGQGERFKRDFERKFIKRGKPSLHLAMDHLNNFAVGIGKSEMRFQEILDRPELDLESRVKIGHLASNHVINLKRLHQKQKTTLTQITQIFLKLSKRHLREMKRVRSRG